MLWLIGVFCLLVLQLDFQPLQALIYFSVVVFCVCLCVGVCNMVMSLFFSALHCELACVSVCPMILVYMQYDEKISHQMFFFFIIRSYIYTLNMEDSIAASFTLTQRTLGTFPKYTFLRYYQVSLSHIICCVFTSTIRRLL